MKVKRRFWLTMTVIGVIAVAGGIWWLATPAMPPQIVTLPDGQTFRFAGVTYGTNNVPPSMLARLAHWLPKPLGNQVRKYAGNRISQRNVSYPEPRVYVWFERVGTNGSAVLYTDFEAMLADEAGVEAGAVDYFGGFASSIAWSSVSFPVVPRRSRVIECDLYLSGSHNISNAAPLARIWFPNPLFNSRPTWQPEPIPAVKQSGDVEVRLEKFGTGLRASGGQPPVLANGKQGMDYRPARGRPGVATYFDVSLKSIAGTNEAWVTQAAELSDATGNVLSSPSQVSSSGNVASPMTFLGEYRLSIPGTLWPDEAAWRLKLWVKRKLPLGPGEYVTFQNVPMPTFGATNWIPITNIVGGVKLVLTKFSRASFYGWRSPATTVQVALPDRPDGIAVDFVVLKADTGDELRAEQGSTGWGPYYRDAYLQPISTNAKTVDITWAVQKMRTVEFLVKPTGAGESGISK